MRIPAGPVAVVLTVGGERVFIGSEQGTRYIGAAGLSLALGRSVTVHLSLGVLRSELPGITVVSDLGSGMIRYAAYGGRSTELFLGSLQEFGLASLPLVRVSPGGGPWSLDLYASGTEYRRVSYRLGVSRSF